MYAVEKSILSFDYGCCKWKMSFGEVSQDFRYMSWVVLFHDY